LLLQPAVLEKQGGDKLEKQCIRLLNKVLSDCEVKVAQQCALSHYM